MRDLHTLGLEQHSPHFGQSAKKSIGPEGPDYLERQWLQRHTSTPKTRRISEDHVGARSGGNAGASLSGVTFLFQMTSYDIALGVVPAKSGISTLTVIP